MVSTLLASRGCFFIHREDETNARVLGFALVFLAGAV